MNSAVESFKMGIIIGLSYSGMPVRHAMSHNHFGEMFSRKAVPFSIATPQSDHGSEFSKHFTKMIVPHGMAHRHSRVRKPNDNAHLERFNRTIQQECIYRIPRSIKVWKKEIPLYLHYYNFERPHMGINYQTPNQVVRSY